VFAHCWRFFVAVYKGNSQNRFIYLLVRILTPSKSHTAKAMIVAIVFTVIKAKKM